MSRSILKDKHIRKLMRKLYNNKGNNSHKHDEMPKNRVPKHISRFIDGSHLQWLQEPGSFGGHKIHLAGHRMVSGIIRQKTKEEIRKEINYQMLND